jgi:hypothetical protein
MPPEMQRAQRQELWLGLWLETWSELWLGLVWGLLLEQWTVTWLVPARQSSVMSEPWKGINSQLKHKRHTFVGALTGEATGVNEHPQLMTASE